MGDSYFPACCTSTFLLRHRRRLFIFTKLYLHLGDHFFVLFANLRSKRASEGRITYGGVYWFDSLHWRMEGRIPLRFVSPRLVFLNFQIFLRTRILLVLCA